MFEKLGAVLENKLKEKASRFVQQNQQYFGGNKQEAQAFSPHNSNSNYQQPQEQPQYNYGNYQQQQYPGQQYPQDQQYHQQYQHNQGQQYSQPHQYTQGQEYNQPYQTTQGPQYTQPEVYNRGQLYNQPQDYTPSQHYNQGLQYNQAPRQNQPVQYNQDQQFNQPQPFYQGPDSNRLPYSQGEPLNDGQGHSIAPANTNFVQGHNQGGAYQGQVHGESISVSNCRGRKRALFIGINYFGSSAELRGCINDVHNVKNFVFSRYGFSEQTSIILTDDQKDPSRIPTRQNIIQGLHWLVEGAAMGDSLFLHFSGHGGSIEDEDGDEVDGFDETIYPVDHESAGVIVDDEIHAICVKHLPAGVRLTAIFDCCHSGTVMDLPFTYTCDGEIEVACQDNRKEAAMALLKAGLSYSRGDRAGAIGLVKEGVSFLFRPKPNKEAQKKAEEEKKSNADVIQFSGCRDNQTSADAIIDNQATGAMSHALISALSQNSNLTYTQLLKQLRDILKGKYSQIPQMSTGRPMDMNTLFVM
ncbi:hypothetical protein K493DRAFT_277186 [Basidiobolus meristosporus CBS 931.73]|uniref:Peptidase C14 caspase domain-containing protein n=1 Tax=Basidiobolus meristosporus CBS 931.73 TaxID=1314790 RepID=A0A1Y1YXC4_9FUNG|nr:hypothetical protein K493DRAFT_277186 [Basidiobolus meristosporus CBS 931.73]|eukprot:ORY02639.1 hypothetical protein K493DRAFT_277186 [Basidiobolus meristosporus CBS 931.73]